MTTLRALTLATTTCAFACAGGTSEPPMPSTPAPTATHPFSTFTTLHGGSAMELAANANRTIVALHAKSATWWDHDAPIEVALTGPGVVGGSRWTSDGKLRVGLGTLDVATHTYSIDPALHAWDSARPIAGIAWFADAAHVALLVDQPAQRVDRPIPAGRDPSERELVIVALAGGEPIRRAITLAGTPSIAASTDRVLVAGNTSLLFDRAANPIAVPTGLPDYVTRVSFGAGVFVVVGATGDVTLVEPRDGSTVATWHPPEPAIDAIAIPHGIVAVDLKGTVRLGCLANGAIRVTAEASAGSAATRVQLVGDRVVVVGDGPDPVRWATFANPCH